MPLVSLHTTERIPEDARRALCARMSRVCAEVIGKPEGYVMALVQDGLTMLHGGEGGPAAFIDVRSIGGLGRKVNQQLARDLCQALTETIKVPPARVYLNFTDLSASSWGHDGTTFG